MKALRIGVVGATGVVGQEILKIIAEHKVPFSELKLLATARSAGKKIDFLGKTYTVEATTAESFDDLDIALFAGGAASKEFGRLAQSKGVVVIDNSSAFRYEKDVPLVVPEINGDVLKNHGGLIANPNCSTILLVCALYPLYKESRIKRIIVSTYQAVSGAGKAGLEELKLQNEQLVKGEPITPHTFQYQIASNLIPHIDVWLDDDYTKEEMKVVWETHKIFADDEIGITATAVRVPVYRSHSESVYVEFEKPISPDRARELLANTPGIVLQDKPQENLYPMPLTSSDTDEVYVGRIRKDLYNPNALDMWISFDQVRKGAATNAVQIAEYLLAHDLV